MNRIVNFQGRQYKVPPEFKFIARDSNGAVYAFMEEPTRHYNYDNNTVYSYGTNLKYYLFLGNTECMEIEV